MNPILLEVIRYFWLLFVGTILFLFFALSLDVLSLLVYGGWHTLLGEWPIFKGCMNLGMYGHKMSVAVLVISYGFICRIVAGPVIPFFLRQPSIENSEA